MIAVSPNAKYDLHLHTTESDGGFDAREIVTAAVNGKMDTIAFTDHNTTRAYEKVAHLQKLVGLKIIAGVEISANSVGTKHYKRLHLLAYGGNARNLHDLDNTLGEISANNEIQLVNNVFNLRDKLGLDIDGAFINEIVNMRTINRTAIAKKLVAAGYMNNEIDAYKKLLMCTNAETQTYKFPAGQAIDIIRSHGMVPVLAHPKAILSVTNQSQDLTLPYKQRNPEKFPNYRAHKTLELKDLKQFEKVFLHRKNFETLVGKLASMGLMGIEGLSAHYTPEDLAYFKWLSRDLGLLNTGGSDFHGNENQNKHIPHTIGTPHMTRKHLDALLASIEASAPAGAQLSHEKMRSVEDCPSKPHHKSPTMATLPLAVSPNGRNASSANASILECDNCVTAGAQKFGRKHTPQKRRRWQINQEKWAQKLDRQFDRDRSTTNG